MNATYERLINLLDEREIRYLNNDDSQSVCTDLQGEVATYRVVAHVDEETELFQVVGYAPIRIPEGSRPAIAETVARANYGLRVGKFELDLDQGEVRFPGQPSPGGRRRGGRCHRPPDHCDDGHAGHVPAGRAVGDLRQRAAEGRHPVC